MQLRTTVITPRGVFGFTCRVHRSDSPEKRLIEPAFYSNAPPKGVHHELEIVLVPQGTIHIHKHPESGRQFICWSGKLKTVGQAEILFKMWCLLEAYSLCTGQDYAKLAIKFQLEPVIEFAAKHQIAIRSFWHE
ncbi:MAG: hypothetical protein HYV68_02830 [Candidatus Taylorbacteria bacterium]|nr:hypothetical protein [Candidatus Taylorbacteria bacterium]